MAPPAGASDPNGANDDATDTDTAGAAIADLWITKDDGLGSYTPGSSVTYTVVVGNDGPSSITGATVTDILSTIPQITGFSWTCVGAGGATCAAGPSAVDINDSVDLPAGGTATYTVVANIDGLASGGMANSAAVVQPGGMTDPDDTNNTATDTNNIAVVADLGTTKVASS